MKLTALALCGSLVCASSAVADGMTDFSFGGTEFEAGMTRSTSGAINVTGYDFSGQTFLRSPYGFSLGLALAYSSQTAFGLPFSATTLSLHPGYEYAMGVSSFDAVMRVGLYGSYTSTNTPALFNPFFGYGIEAAIACSAFTFGGHIGLYNGLNIANPGNNTSIGVFASYNVTDRLEVFATYDKDKFGFWGNNTTGYQAGLRYDVSDALNLDVPIKLEAAYGQLDVNGIKYSQIRVATHVFLNGNSESGGDGVSEADRKLLLQSVALRHTFSF